VVAAVVGLDSARPGARENDDFGVTDDPSRKKAARATTNDKMDMMLMLMLLLSLLSFHRVLREVCDKGRPSGIGHCQCLCLCLQYKHHIYI
jgi:hypothetical protein